MKLFLLSFLLILTMTKTMADITVSVALGKYAWDKRQLIVFTPDIQHKEYKLFKKISIDKKEALEERNLQTWHVIADSEVLLNSVTRGDVNNQDFRVSFKVKKNEFRIVLLGYDQNEKLRIEDSNLDKIIAAIDLMPMRIQEMKNE